MKFKFLLIIILIVSYACNNNSVEIKKLRVKKRLLLEQITIEKQKNDRLNSIIDSQRNVIIELEKVKFELNPSDWIYCVENPGGGYVYYILYKEGSIVFTVELNSRKYCQLGNWEIENDSLFFHFYKLIFQRGIGDPYNQNGTNLPDLYNEYVKTVNWINETEKFYWNNWKEVVKIGAGWRVIDSKPSEFPFKNFDDKIVGDYPFMSYEKITKERLNSYRNNKDVLRIAKNEIFARYGLKFKSKDLQEHFASKSWYKEKYDNVDKYLSDIEKYNIKIVVDYIENN